MKQFNNRFGFTLIELLIVIAVLGILVTGILVVLNPVEQTRRASDSQRAAAISQLATAITAFSTSQLLQDFEPLATSSTWQTTLKNAGEIKNLVTVPQSTNDCTSTRKEGGVCSCTTSTGTTCSAVATVVGTDTNEDIAIWVYLDSTAEKTRAGCTATQFAIVAYVSSQQKTGVGCVTTLGSDASTAIDSAGTAGSIFSIDLK